MANGEALSRAFGLLACAAVEPRIGPILFVDLDPDLLPVIAGCYRELVAAAESPAVAPDGSEPDQAEPAIHALGSWTEDEELWHTLRATGGRLELAPGLLVARPGRPAPILLVAQLAALGLGAVRALLTQAEPDARWLAASGRDELAAMSPHLLDRFVARVDGRAINEELSAAMRAAAGTATLHDLVRRAAAQHTGPHRPSRRARWTDAAADEVVKALPPSVSRRQDLALAHAAAALASLGGGRPVGPRHVREAAILLGLSTLDPAPADPERPAPPAGHAPASASAAESGPTPPDRPDRPDRAARRKSLEPRSEQVAASQTGDAFDTEPGDVSRAQSLYPELQPDALPALGSLRSPRRGRGGGHGPRGPVVGVKPVDSPAGLRDLALCATVIQSGLSRAVRARQPRPPRGSRPGTPSVRDAAENGWFLHAHDLRQFHRRAARRSTLVLVLDHTCLPGWRWSALLAPHLHWAYQESATIGVVEFGHRDTADELAAHSVHARDLVDPRVARSVSGREPGRASPLAHALDLAARQLRRAVRACGQDGEIRLVVLTDGRGNVPLAASLLGRPPASPVRREGVEDALRAARILSGLGRTRVHRYLLGPQPHQYPGLLYDLADALDADLHLGAPDGSFEGAEPRERRS